MESRQPDWCLYWLPFQWMFLNLKKFYFVDLKINKKSRHNKEAIKASLFSNKYEYLHVVKEVNMFLKNLSFK